MFLLDTPILKVFVDPQYVNGGDVVKPRIEAYLFAVTLLNNRPLLFTVHTVHGAVYSRLPINALSWKERPQDNSYDKWGSISGSGQIIQHAYLKDYRCQIGKEPGRYYCTIDYNEGGFAQDPEQHKTSNIILMDKGGIWIVPNNEVLFTDDHFIRPVKNVKDLPYRRNKVYWT